MTVSHNWQRCQWRFSRNRKLILKSNFRTSIGDTRSLIGVWVRELARSSRRKFSLVVLLIACVPAAAQDVHIDVAPNLKNDATHPLQFPTIQMALDHAPESTGPGRLYVHIAPGVYPDRIYVSQLRPRTTLLGTGKLPSEVVITSAQNGKTSQSTFFSETVEVLGDNFEADNITFENTAGATGQALAISVTADRAVFKHCRFLGYQDTLFANYGRQYYVDSYISGAVDFIFGNATAVFERCEIHILRSGYLTAQSRTSAAQTTGYVFLHSRVTSGDFRGTTFSLGRPWRQYARVVFLDTELPQGVDLKGWSDWGRDPQDTFYAERGSTGPGASPSERVPWSHQLTEEQSREFMPLKFLGGLDGWNPVAEAARLP
jgi:pectinesterase